MEKDILEIEDLVYSRNDVIFKLGKIFINENGGIFCLRIEGKVVCQV